MRAVAGLLLLGACGGASGDSTRLLPGSGTPAGVPTTTTPTGPYLRCRVQEDNALRFDCDGRLVTPGVARAWLESPDGSLRELALDQVDDTYSFVAWKLRPQTTYTVRVTTDAGEQRAELEVGVVPEELALVPITTGTASFDEVLVPFECNGLALMALLDTDGTTLWYQAMGSNGALYDAVEGFDAGPDGVSVLVGHKALRRWSWEGTLQQELLWEGVLPTPVHHDVLWRNDHHYVLTAERYVAEDGYPYVMDGVLVYDAMGTLVASWNLADVYEPTGFQAPGGFWSGIYSDAQDWAHTNGIEVDADGDWLLSSKSTNTVIKVRGDWTEPDFGELVWAMSGDPESKLGSDFAFQGGFTPFDFQDQHHPHYDHLGRLVLFDNRSPIDPVGSRATAWSVDEANRTVTLVQALPVARSCPVQSSAFVLPNEHFVTACASRQILDELAAGQDGPQWTMEVACATGPGKPLMVRAMPQPLDAQPL